MAAMNVWDHANGVRWRSVFGKDNVAAKQDDGGKVIDDTYVSCGTCPGTNAGHTDWLTLFAGNTLASKYQDGHFAYAVVPGGGSGKSAFPPVMYVVDMENASDFNNVIEP
jgi:threonine dehydrogenase-like Zn-dependent dehydrogenase